MREACDEVLHWLDVNEKDAEKDEFDEKLKEVAQVCQVPHFEPIASFYSDLEI